MCKQKICFDFEDCDHSENLPHKCTCSKVLPAKEAHTRCRSCHQNYLKNGEDTYNGLVKLNEEGIPPPSDEAAFKEWYRLLDLYRERATPYLEHRSDNKDSEREFRTQEEVERQANTGVGLREIIRALEQKGAII